MDLKEEVQKHSPFFLEQKIHFLDTEELSSLEPFIVETDWEDNSSINVFLVEGTRHPDYQGMSWSEFLEKGKRMRINLELFRTNPDYYLGTEHKVPTMSYVQLDGGPYYVDADGNHRTCIAKMFFFLRGMTMLHGVSITRHRVDREAMELFQTLREHFRFVRPLRKKLTREDTAGWMRETFDTVFEVVDGRGHVLTLSRERALSIVNRPRESWFWRLKNFLRKNVSWKETQKISAKEVRP